MTRGGNYMSYLFDYNRPMTRGNYETDFSLLKEGSDFPSNETKARNIIYRFNKRLYTGEYAQNKMLTALIDDVYKQINYKVIPTNYFKLVINKLDSLLFSNELTIKTGDVETDRLVTKLVEKTAWVKQIREAIKLCEIYGDSIIKTSRCGVSVVNPTFGYKVVDISDKQKVRGYVLHEILYDVQEGINGSKDYIPSHIRILICCKGFDYERIYEYKGNNVSGVLGKPVRYKYKDRWIPRKGRYYWSGIDEETVQWLSVNTTDDGVYGTSSFKDIKDIIFAIEQRLSTENWIIDAHGKPLLIAGSSCFRTDEITGEYYLSTVNGKYLVNKGGLDNTKPEYLTWDGKLEASKQVRDDLVSTFYELSEMGKTFLTGDYQGNISEESLNNIIKSAIDRGHRELNDVWYEVRKSLYVLCRLNNIDVRLENLNIDFNVGRVDDEKQVAEICDMLISQGLFSKQTLLAKYWGYTEADATAEFQRIQEENKGGIGDNDINGSTETIVRV